MVIMNISDITKITLYTNECYGCDRANKFGPLRLFVIKNELPLQTLVVKRVELNKKWMAEAVAFKKDLPIVAIEFDDGESEYIDAMNYNEFLERLEYKLSDKPKKHVAKRRQQTKPVDDGAVSKDGNDQNETAPVTSTPSVRGVDAEPERSE